MLLLFKILLECTRRRTTKRNVQNWDKVKFTKTEYQLPLPFYFVADCDCILVKNRESEKPTTTEPSAEELTKKSITTITQSHIHNPVNRPSHIQRSSYMVGVQTNYEIC